MFNMFQNQEFIASCAFCILNIFIAICLFTFGIRYRQIAYSRRTTRISFKNAIPDLNLKLLYGRKLINELSYTDLIIWSKGRRSVNAADIAPTAPLTISVSEDADILDYQIVTQNEPANNFNLCLDGRNIIVHFDYLARKNGAIIRIAHTGNDESISVSCILKDGHKTLCVNQRKGFIYKLLKTEPPKDLRGYNFLSYIE